MKAVLLHDWLTGYRGGERVLDAFCEIYPEAPLYTLVHIPNSTSPRIENRLIHASFLNRFPGVERNYRKLLPLFPRAVESMQIAEADLVLSSSHCVIKGVRKPKGAVHVCYIHSPMRYMYDQYDHYFGPQASLPIRWGAKLFRKSLVDWDRASNDNVDVMIANSKFVQKRIEIYYGRESEVIHPFVELSDFTHLRGRPAKKDESYVMVTAFAPNKRVDIAIEAFNRLGKPLLIIGSGQLDRELRAMAQPNIRFMGNLGREAVIEHLAKAQGFIFPGVEDFGITPLEALASGTPVVAFRAGGVLETLTDEDSVFFDQPTAESLMDAVQRLEREGRTPDFQRLEKFSRPRFLREIRESIARACARARAN